MVIKYCQVNRCLLFASACAGSHQGYKESRRQILIFQQPVLQQGNSYSPPNIIMVILQEHSALYFQSAFNAFSYFIHTGQRNTWSSAKFCDAHLQMFQEKYHLKGDREEGEFVQLKEKKPLKNKGNIQYLKQSINEYFIQIFKREHSVKKK